MLENPCSPGLVDEVLADAESLLNDAFDEGPEVDADGVIYFRYPGGTTQYHWQRVLYAWKAKRSVRELALAPTVLAATEELFGRRVLPFQTLNFPVGTEQPPHIDAFSTSTRIRRGTCAGYGWRSRTSTWTTARVIYYPGSHKLPLPEWDGDRPRPPVSRCSATTTRTEAAVPRRTRHRLYPSTARGLIDKHGFEPHYAAIPQGQALIWAPNILHRGAIQKRTRVVPGIAR